MELIHTIEWMKQLSRQLRQEGGIAGLVPTGGRLHAGHFSLVETARKDCSPVIVSILGNREDCDPGPHPGGLRSLDPDRAALESLGVKYLFAPLREEFFPRDFSTRIVVEGIEDRLEGRSRPGRLRGIATEMLKLIEIIQPAFVYVGRKEAQPVSILRRMARDLNLDTQIIACPIVREPDGLALSSRNRRLHDAERQAASVLHRALDTAQERILRGERRAVPLVEAMRRVLAEEPLATIDYVEIVDADTFQPAPRLRGECLAVLAVFIGSICLTDNMLIEEREGRVTCTI